MKSFYYRHLDVQHGPISEADLRYLVESNLLAGQTPAWPVGDPETRARPVRDLLRSPPSLPTCAACAATLAPDSRFCSQCGAPVGPAVRGRHPSGVRRAPTLPWQPASRKP